MFLIIDFTNEIVRFKAHYIRALENANPIFTPEAQQQIFVECVRQAVDCLDADYTYYTQCISAYPRFDMLVGFRDNYLSMDPAVLATFREGFMAMAQGLYFRAHSLELFKQGRFILLENVGYDRLVVQLMTDSEHAV